VSVLTGHPEPSRRHRVAALSPDDRRAALIEATIPLLRQHGVQLTTRQIADAAGVAEGTIFGVFADKASLIRAALITCFDPTQAVAAIRGVRTVGDLRERLVMIVDMLGRGIEMMAPLMASVRASGSHTGDQELASAMMRARDAIIKTVAEVVEPDRARLRRSPEAVAQALVYMIFASGSGFGPLVSVDSRELVSLLLDGLLVRSPSSSPPGDSTC
jgi:AcrR family transcriptional regulator